MHIAADGWYRLETAVRFRDIDAMGHAHHTLPLIYLEEARAAFWRELKGDDSVAAIDYVLAEIVLRLHARILCPAIVHVGLCITRVGAKSFTSEFDVRAQDGGLLASGTTVQVAFDYAANSAKPIEPSDRAVLQQWMDARQNSSARPADIAPITPPST